MASVINTNVASLSAQRNLTMSQTDLATSVERLSSGTRINRAKDDAAGLGISAKLQAQVKGLNASVRNANDAISVVQTAEGALAEVADMLQRLKELSTQGKNDSLNSDQRSSIKEEANALLAEIDSIKSRTTFNGTSLLNSTASLVFQAGSAVGDTFSISLSGAKIGTRGSASTVVTTVDMAGSAASNFTTLETSVDADITKVATARGKLGAYQNRLDHAIANMQATSENLQASNSRILDTDYAAETAQLTKTQIHQQAATAMLAQANQMPNVILALLK